MLLVKVNQGNIEKAIKDLKGKLIKTKQNSILFDKKEFKTHYEAVEFFASRKKLSIANFLKIYKVFEV